MTTSIIASGSIKDVAKKSGMAVALLSAKVVLLCDRSGSMYEMARGGKASYQIEDDIVKRLQAKYPGQVVLLAFNDVVWTCLDGVLPMPNGNTNMLDVFDKAQPYVDMGMRAILITDGQPSHDEGEVIRRARQFRGKMDTIFVGPELSPGASFLKRLAASIGGQNSVCDLKQDPRLLEIGIERLLLKAGK